MIVVAEKGSVARAIRRAIKAPITVLALSGHLLELDFPQEYNRWREVNPQQLFEAPVKWTVRDPKTYRMLVETLRSSSNPMLVLATDNDHEGEFIAYEVLLAARETLGSVKFFRMRFNSTTPSELRRAWETLEPDLNWGWVWKAYFRHKFDLITGAIYTRLLTLSAREADRNVRLISWGSCQTPTLWFILEREKQIREFKPETYYTLEAILNVQGVKVKVSSSPIKDRVKAESLYRQAAGRLTATVEAFTLQREAERKPLPTETDSMLQDLTKILGVSAVKIMGEAEQLYAEGYISYPRTQTNQWVKVDHQQILNMLSTSFLAEHVRLESFNPRDGRKNDGAHPPIYPTRVCSYRDLKGRIWEYVARR
ncbi:MAG: DNA topoisomerase III, partial [Candidatus Hecatellales archaeon]